MNAEWSTMLFPKPRHLWVLVLPAHLRILVITHYLESIQEK